MIDRTGEWALEGIKKTPQKTIRTIKKKNTLFSQAAINGYYFYC